jgi:Raf kinase inhibitor-like YbhB/YbcL family protein
MRPILSALILLLAATPAMAKHARTLKVTSTDFKNNGAIPKANSCEGAGTSPELKWSKAPKGTQSIAILVEDPDAPKGTFTHWLITGLPATQTSLDADAKLPDSATEMKNDAGTSGFTAPCPPSGNHHYLFHVYALDAQLPSITSRADFLAAIAGHVLAEGRLTGTYQKAPQ